MLEHIWLDIAMKYSLRNLHIAVIDRYTSKAAFFGRSDVTCLWFWAQVLLCHFSYTQALQHLILAEDYTKNLIGSDKSRPNRGVYYNLLMNYKRSTITVGKNDSDVPMKRFWPSFMFYSIFRLSYTIIFAPPTAKMK